jgi:asparagine synthase (glutamine-hydrolysing)
MQSQQTIDRLVNLMDNDANVLLSETYESAAAIVRSGDRQRIGQIEGQFAICEKDGRTVRMARTIGRPMRYFMAKLKAGPCLVVAERIDEIAAWLEKEGLRDQFDPSYTRMVPAHYLIELQLLGCPDPNPAHQRFFTPQRNRLPADVSAIGHEYITRLARVCDAWLDRIDASAPIGVLFSGGVDSGAVLCVLYDLLLRRGQAPTRLKAFSLAVDGNAADFKQAAEFVEKCGFPELLEVVEVPESNVNWRRAIELVEDYKPLDIQSATFAAALCEAIRERYPSWRYLVDGDGGDENLKDYPIEENPELTIRSVLNNLMLYQEGWGVDSIKHSLTYSGGQSRGHTRTSAVGRAFGFSGFSPFAVPSVIEVAEAIPFIELTDWDHEALYRLKGAVVAAGVQSVTGIEMPVHEKRRFQHGAVATETFSRLFPTSPNEYRKAFRELCG